MINFWHLIVVAVVLFVIGWIWHGVFFGKMWARAMGMDMSQMTPEKKKEMQKKMWPAYVLQFLLSLLMVYVLATFINFGGASGVGTAFLVWLGFTMPVAAGSSLWSGKGKKASWQLFFISAGYQLITLLIAGWILSAWH